MTISDIPVDVVWSNQTWRGERIVEIRRFTDKMHYAFLEGRPMCPVRIDRIPQLKISDRGQMR